MNWKELFTELKKNDKVKVINKTPNCTRGCGHNECMYFGKIGFVEEPKYRGSNPTIKVYVMFSEGGCSGFNRIDLVKLK